MSSPLQPPPSPAVLRRPRELPSRSSLAPRGQLGPHSFSLAWPFVFADLGFQISVSFRLLLSDRWLDGVQ